MKATINGITYEGTTEEIRDIVAKLPAPAATATVARSRVARRCPRCKSSAAGCEFLDGETCKGVVYPTCPPQYDPCVFLDSTN